jgi:hypothetical protein
VAQQMWWCMTYTERYLKMTAFWIIDNSLDFDSDEQYKARQKTTKKAEPKDENPNGRFLKATKSVNFMKQCMDEDDFIKKIKDKYTVDEIQESQLREAYKHELWIDDGPVDLPFGND